MKTILIFVKKYAKEIIFSLLLTAITFGLYGLYKLYKHKKES